MAAIERIESEAPPPAGADGIRAAARGRRATPRQVLAAVLIGAFVLSVFAAPDLPAWAGRLEDGAMTPLLRATAYHWNRAVSQIGLGIPQAALRRAITRFKDSRWR